MKFTQAQRIYHDVNFNPPSNLYNLQKSSDKKILYGSLAGPTLTSNQKNTFGFNKRFEEGNNNNMPGPGQYFAAKKQINYDFTKDLSNPKVFLKNTFRNQELNPSIPYKILSDDNLDEEDKKFLKELSLIQNPARAAENIHKKQPSYSFSKSPRKLLPQIIEQKQKNHKQNNIFNQQLDKIEEKNYQQVIQQISKDKQNSSKGKKKLITFNQTIKKASKKRNQTINNITPDFIPSLELIDLMSKMRTRYVPGPGTYNVNKNDAFTQNLNSIVQSNKNGAIFSSVKRFTVDKKSIIGPGAYQIKDESFSKKGGMISREKRNLFNMKQEIDIQHRFYINPDFQELASSSKRSQSCSNLRKGTIQQVKSYSKGFGSSSKRFSIASISNEEDKKAQINDYEIQKKNSFKIQIKAKLKKMYLEDRRSTKQDSGLLGLSTMASTID